MRRQSTLREGTFWEVTRRYAKTSVGQFVFLVLCLLLILLVGGWRLSPDSEAVLGMVRSGNWNNHHPWPYVALVWFTTLGGTWLAPYFVLQVVVLAGALALLSTGLSRSWQAGLAPLFAVIILLLPWPYFIGQLSVFLWKDVWFYVGCILLAALLVRIPRFASAELDFAGRHWILLLSLAVALMSLTRWTGAFAALLVVGVSLVFLPRSRRLRPAVVSLSIAAASLLSVFLGPRLIPFLDPMPPHNQAAAEIGDLAWMLVNAPDDLDTSAKTTLLAIAPLEEWIVAEQGLCQSVDSVVYELVANGGPGRQRALEAASDGLVRTWRSTALTDPWTATEARICRLGPLVTTTGGWKEDWDRPWRWPAMVFIIGSVILVLAAYRGRRLQALVLTMSVPFAVLITYVPIPFSTDPRYYIVSVWIAVIVGASALNAIIAQRISRRRLPS